jgi:sentrin-specific protease 1
VTQQQKVNSNQGAFYNFNDYTERLQKIDFDFSHFNNVSSLIFAPQNNFADTEIVAEICSVTVKRMDFKRLRPGAWLNDEIINLYIEMLKRFDSDLCAKDAARKPTLFFSTWFMDHLLIRDGGYNYSQVRRQTKRRGIDINILDYEQVIIPINISNSHWMVNRINISGKKVIEGDSLASGTPRSSSMYTRAVMRWIADEHDSRSIPFDQQSWSQVVLSASQFPQQTNNEDCGVFTLMAAEYFARGRKVNFDQESMDFFRMRIAINILKKEISDDDI